MNEVKVSWETLLRKIKARLSRLEDFNLIMVALPLETAHNDAPKLARELNAEYVDFDQELIRRLEQDGWEEHVSLTKHGNLDPGKTVAGDLLEDVTVSLDPDRCILLGNPNLAAFYKLDLGTLLYPRTKAGHCILAAPGRVRRQTLLLHGLHPQTGSGFMPIWELVGE